MKKLATALATTLCLTACSHPELDGASLAQDKGCVTCHGLNGEATAPNYPHLNIQWERYLRVELLRYKNGERNNAIMNGMAAQLTDDEIRALAKHYGI